MPALSDETVVAQSSDAIEGDLPTETVLLRISEGRAVKVNETGAWLWKQTAEPVTLGELTDRLADEHDISREQASSDLIRFISDLSDRGFIDLR